MKIFDSNIWIAFIDLDDSCHGKAQELLYSCDTKDIYITDHIILEVVTLLLRKSGKYACDMFIELIENNSEIQIFYTNKNLFSQYLTYIRSNNFEKLAFVDQSLLYLSEQFEIVTFDKELIKAI